MEAATGCCAGNRLVSKLGVSWSDDQVLWKLAQPGASFGGDQVLWKLPGVFVKVTWMVIAPGGFWVSGVGVQVTGLETTPGGSLGW